MTVDFHILCNHEKEKFCRALQVYRNVDRIRRSLDQEYTEHEVKPREALHDPRIRTDRPKHPAS